MSQGFNHLLQVNPRGEGVVVNIFATNLGRILFLTELDPFLPLEFFAPTLWPQNVTLQSLPTLILVSSGLVAFSDELQMVQETQRKIYNHMQAP